MELARKAGVKIAFGSDEWFERNGCPRSACRRHAGLIEPENFGDLIGIEGDPLAKLSEIQNVKFVMKGGRIVSDGRR
jgi:imidazolonepropionase-like amidohydrolase